jgi:ABC-type transport system involved in multi-copper enzyme maturation permease subunit
VSGVLTVARLELTVRVRAGRWRWLLGGWFVVLVGFTALLRLALSDAHDLQGSVGTVMYGGLQLFLLALALLVMPALTAQSVNGDRERGTLGVLQVTRLSAFDIAGGKLLAAWGTACIFLVVSAPLVAWSMAEGGVPVIRVVIVTLVVALLLGVICAISLGLSALLARGTTSSVLSYLAVFGLTVGTLILFGLVTVATTQIRSVHYTPPGAPQGCCTYRDSEPRTDLTWWLLAPNPFVVLADAAPVAKEESPVCHTVVSGASSSTFCTTPVQEGVDPLGDISRSVRSLRSPPVPPGVPTSSSRRGGLVWPWGLGFDVLLGGFMFGVAVRRLRTPRRTLPRGVRLA